MSRWFRHYAGMCRDEKLVRVALKAKQPIERVIWIYAAILESASEVNDNGRYDFDVGEASYFLRADEDDVRRIVDALEGMERLCEGSVAKWGDRQFKSDTSADRQRNYRDRQKTSDSNNGDVAVTSPSRDSDAPELDTDTDTDTEKKERNARAPRLSVSKDFDERFWPEFPNKVGRKTALRSWHAAIRRGVSVDEIISGLNRYKSTKPPDRPWLNPATFLNQERWADEMAPATTVLPFSQPPPQEKYTEAEEARRLKEWRERGFYEATK